MIRSSLESKIYILEGPRPAYQLARRAGLGSVDYPSGPTEQRPRGSVIEPINTSHHPNWTRRILLIAVGVIILGALLVYRLRTAPFQWQIFLTTFYRVNWLWLGDLICLMLTTYVGPRPALGGDAAPLGRKLSLRKLIYDTAIGFTAVVLLGRPGEVVRPYLISVQRRCALFLANGGLAAGANARSAGGTADFRLRTHPHPGRIAAGPQSPLGAGNGRLPGDLDRGGLYPILLVLFRSFSGPVRKRILSALTFLPAKHYQRADRHAGGLFTGHGMHARPGLPSASAGLYTALEWAVIVGSYYTLFRSFPATSGFDFTDVVSLPRICRLWQHRPDSRDRRRDTSRFDCCTYADLRASARSRHRARHLHLDYYIRSGGTVRVPVRLP